DRRRHDEQDRRRRPRGLPRGLRPRPGPAPGFPDPGRRGAMMKRSRVRLAVTALLFLGWIGWLAYLAATTTHPGVLSPPQFLEAKLYAIATVGAGTGDGKAPADRVTVREVVWADAEVPQRGDLSGKEVTVRHLSDCGPQQGWAGPGEYILALRPFGPDYQLA